MDTKYYITQVICSANQRQKFLRAVPHLFDDYYLTRDGKVVTGEELEKLSSLNYFLRGLGLVSQAMRA